MIETMELCTARGGCISRFPLDQQPKHLPPNHIQSFHAQIRFPFISNQARFKSGLRCNRGLCLRSKTSEGASTETTPYGRDETETEPDDGLITMEVKGPGEKKEEYYTQLSEASQDDSLVDNPMQLFKFLEDFDIKIMNLVETSAFRSMLSGYLSNLILYFYFDFTFWFDYDETYSLLVFGGGCAVAIWLAAAVVGAIDSIPLFPKVLELIGLGYTVWFTSRYLLFKESRDELLARVEQIKQEVLGSKDD